MRDSWVELVDTVLRPSRRELERCLSARDQHLTTRRGFSEARARAIANCERRIESARTAVFAANDGVISRRMTELEREWRLLSRRDPDAGLMELWSAIAPASWIDRKRWRGVDPAARVDAATVLAADVEGVDAAEHAVGSLRAALTALGATPFGPRVQWRSSDRDVALLTDLLAEPLRRATAAVAATDAQPVVLLRAQRLEVDVQRAASARFPERPLLVSDLAHAAFVDYVWRAAAFFDLANPVTSLRDLWKAGYGLSAIDTAGVTLEVPPLEPAEVIVSPFEKSGSAGSSAGHATGAGARHPRASSEV